MSSSGPGSVSELLHALGVPGGGVIYVQSSVDWITRAGFAASDVLPALKASVGSTGTLVMPSYPFHTTHVEYLGGHPTFDVRKTPSAIGLLPEMLRRTKGAERSLDPDFCVSALGPDAERIAGDRPADGDPFGPDSSYQRMLEGDTTFVGLGVSLNTCSFIHAIDSRCASGYPAAVYESAVFNLTVIDAADQERPVTRKALRPEFQRLTAPSSVIDVMKPDAVTFTTIEINGARFFRWRLAPWAEWCEAHAAEQHRGGAWPCWLSRLSGQVT